MDSHQPTSVSTSIFSLITATTRLTNATESQPVHTSENLFLAVAIIEVILCLVGAVGNLLVFAAVINNKKLQIVTNFYVVSLSIADFCVSVFVVPFRVAENFTSYHLGYSWTFREPVPEIVQFIGRAAQLVSLACLAAVSIDRLLALRFPMRYHTKIRHSTRPTAAAIVVIWISCILLTCSPKILGIPNQEALIIFVAFVFTVTLVISISYCNIFFLMKKNSRNRRHLTRGQHVQQSQHEMRRKSYESSRNVSAQNRVHKTPLLDSPFKRRQNPGLMSGKDHQMKSCSADNASAAQLVFCSDAVQKYNGTATGNSNTESEESKRNDCESRKKVTTRQNAANNLETKQFDKESVNFIQKKRIGNRLRKESYQKSGKDKYQERKLAVTIAMVIGAFVALVYPRIIFILYHAGRRPETTAARIIRPWLRVLLYMNVVCNPLLYAWRLKQFRKEFKNILSILCICCICPRISQNQESMLAINLV